MDIGESRVALVQYRSNMFFDVYASLVMMSPNLIRSDKVSRVAGWVQRERVEVPVIQVHRHTTVHLVVDRSNSKNM